jgi:L-ascorbate metabolism protein UlaG (beta-lactamase superfamily)
MADIRWYGHNCFRIRAREGTIVTDPLDRKTGYSIGSRLSTDIVTVSHDHPGHTNLKAIKDDYALIDSPGEYEIHEIFVYGHRSFHDANKGADHGYNTIYVIEAENMRIAHLGDLGHDLTPDLTDAIDNIDVLLIPVGGGEGIISPETAAKIVGHIEPDIVIPMQYATGRGDKDLAPVDTFAKHLGMDLPEAIDKITFKPSDLVNAMSLVVLTPTTESA